MFHYHSKERFNLKQKLPRKVYISAKTHKAFLCGGAITSLFSNSKINDFDFYFRNSEALELFESDIKKEGFNLIINTDNALTYQKENTAFQLIKKPGFFKDTTNEIFNMFDFTVCMGAYDFDSESFVLEERFLYHLARKEIIFNTNAEYPLASLCRIRKYLNRGFSVSAAELVKIALKIHSLDLKDYKTLKDQLMGIDTMIFRELMSKLEEFGDTPYTFEEVLCMIEDCLMRIGLEEE